MAFRFVLRHSASSTLNHIRASAGCKWSSGSSTISSLQSEWYMAVSSTKISRKPCPSSRRSEYSPSSVSIYGSIFPILPTDVDEPAQRSAHEGSYSDPDFRVVGNGIHIINARAGEMRDGVVRLLASKGRRWNSL